MYSRNISFPERATSIRNARQGELRNAQGIPVKSYTDRAAYEHFGNLGNDNTDNGQRKLASKVEEIPVQDTEKETAEQTFLPESAVIPTVSEKEHQNTDVIVVRKDKSDNHGDFSIKDLIPKLSNFIDCDIILPIFAISLFLLGDKESGNIITSIALVAIMLL